MKKSWIVLSVVVVLSVGGISYSFADEKYSEFEKGAEFAKYYQKTIAQKNNKISSLTNESNEISEDEILDKIARYKAYSKAFGIQLSEEQAIEKLKERKLLAKFANEHNIYPADKEIDAYIKEIAESYKSTKYDVVEGIMEELGIDEEEFFFRFSRDGYEEALVRLKILEKLKDENERLTEESEAVYHNRMLEELNSLIKDL
ncbi:hypothetical protein [uncultured Brevibacillus sp.]|uniref:hypothetical protein n=1 Tax=uncultured Brevibacillus sp. TaxID=169970 RepID=UPI002592CAA5|nr:hypothetical protein [uncultured Brevibacillus sp.]